jgi:hypothetical protein
MISSLLPAAPEAHIVVDEPRRSITWDRFGTWSVGVVSGRQFVIMLASFRSKRKLNHLVSCMK